MNSSKPFRTVSNYFLENSFEPLRTVSNYSLATYIFIYIYIIIYIIYMYMVVFHTILLPSYNIRCTVNHVYQLMYTFDWNFIHVIYYHTEHVIFEWQAALHIAMRYQSVVIWSLNAGISILYPACVNMDYHYIIILFYA